MRAVYLSPAISNRSPERCPGSVTSSVSAFRRAPFLDRSETSGLRQLDVVGLAAERDVDDPF